MRRPWPGQGGIRIELRDENRNTRSTITGADGSYEFDKLCTGITTTTIDLASLPPGPSLTTAQLRVITLSLGLLDAPNRTAGVVSSPNKTANNSSVWAPSSRGGFSRVASHSRPRSGSGPALGGSEASANT